jgi:hypothetical protein
MFLSLYCTHWLLVSLRDPGVFNNGDGEVRNLIYGSAIRLTDGAFAGRGHVWSLNYLIIYLQLNPVKLRL